MLVETIMVSEELSNIINKKWSIQILFVLFSGTKISYKSLKNILSIPNSTLSLRVNELVKIRYIERYVYGSTSKPHNTDYKITQIGLNYINNLINDKNQ